MRGERENFFSTGKEFFPLPPRPSLPFKKSGELFYLPLPTRVGNRAFTKQKSRLFTVTKTPVRKHATLGSTQPTKRKMQSKQNPRQQFPLTKTSVRKHAALGSTQPTYKSAGM